MRLGTLRAGAAVAVLCAWTASATAGELFPHVIPREVAAVNLDTGGPIMQPPVPYGCYAKDHAGTLFGVCAKAKGCLGGLFHHGNKACGACGGRGCGLCGGSGLCGDGNGSGSCGTGGGKHGHGAGMGLGHGHVVATMPATGAGVAVVDPNAVAGSIQSVACGACGGHGCGLCKGHGLCGPGMGMGLGHGNGPCGDPGCGLCGGHGKRHGLLGHGKDPCGNCGGRGCQLCRGLRSLLGGFGARHGVKYFVGAGGPVPITPGYVPYIVTTRSPRDYFAFPPFSDPTEP